MGIIRNPVGLMVVTIGKAKTLLQAIYYAYSGSEVSSWGQAKDLDQKLGAEQIANLVRTSQGLSVESQDR